MTVACCSTRGGGGGGGDFARELLIPHEASRLKERECRKKSSAQNPGSYAGLACLYPGYDLAFNKILFIDFFPLPLHNLSQLLGHCQPEIC